MWGGRRASRALHTRTLRPGHSSPQPGLACLHLRTLPAAQTTPAPTSAPPDQRHVRLDGAPRRVLKRVPRQPLHQQHQRVVRGRGVQDDLRWRGWEGTVPAGQAGRQAWRVQATRRRPCERCEQLKRCCDDPRAGGWAAACALTWPGSNVARFASLSDCGGWVRGRRGGSPRMLLLMPPLQRAAGGAGAGVQREGQQRRRRACWNSRRPMPERR